MDGLLGKYKVLLAPMAGVSDSVFRSLCRSFGADLAYSEMVSAKGLSHGDGNTRRLLELGEDEGRIAVQLFGHDPRTVASQAAWVEDALGDRLALIDLNMGCPVRKMVSKGDGAALMKSPGLACEIVRAAKAAVSHPVTCKFRRGYSEDGGEDAVDFALRLEEAGADALAVHGRYATQMYRGCADWGCIKRVKEKVRVPVVGNGDVRCAEDAIGMVERTNCDAVMVGRGAEGNPWVFSQIKAAFEGRKAPDGPDYAERIGLARRHAQLLRERGDGRMMRMRKHAMWYVSGLPGASFARGAFNSCSTYEDFCAVLDDLLERLDAYHAA